MQKVPLIHTSQQNLKKNTGFLATNDIHNQVIQQICMGTVKIEKNPLQLQDLRKRTFAKTRIFIFI